MLISTLIVEDEGNNTEHLLRLITMYTPQLKVVATADTIADACTAIGRHRPALVLLDIQLRGETGFDLLARLKPINFEVVFITAHDQYALRAIKFSALDYLLKPVTPEDLQAAVTKAVLRISQKQKDDKLENLLSFIAADNRHRQKIALPLQDETRYEPILSIIRLESSSNYCYVLLESGEKLLVCKTLKEFAGMLEPYGFIRVHQSHLVNTRFIKSYLKEDGGTLLLTNKIKIPVSKAHRAMVKEKLGWGF